MRKRKKNCKFTASSQTSINENEMKSAIDLSKSALQKSYQEHGKLPGMKRKILTKFHKNPHIYDYGKTCILEKRISAGKK